MGRLAAPHGVRGAFKVQPLSADPASLLGFPQWWLRLPRTDEWTAYAVRTCHLRSGTIVAELDGIATREAAGALRGATVGVPAGLLPLLGEDEFYESDLAGMTVVNRTGEVLGRVVDFMESGAHPILRVADTGGGERLIPWVAQYIERVDASQRRIDVDWPADY